MEDTLLLFSDYAESMASMKDKESTSISKLDRRRLPSEDDKFKEQSQAHAEFQKVRLEVMGVLKSTKMATRTGSWTKSGGITRKGANRGKGWYQERGYGTPAVGPLPDTEEGRKVYGESAGKMPKAGFPSGYTFVPSQVRERKKRSDN